MPDQDKKTVVILGGGFGGVNTAALLAKKIGDKARIIVVDRQNYQLYHPGLYEVATSEEEFTTIDQLKRSIALPLKQILPKTVEFIQGEVELIDQSAKTVTVSGNRINFDFLVVALGSIVDCFGNRGLEHHCIHMKTLKDALYLKNEFEAVVEQYRMDLNKKMLRFLIGGGGFSGVELAAELHNLVKIISWKYHYPPEKIEILVVEGGPQLLPGLPKDLSEKIYTRLKMLGIEIRLNNLITEVHSGHVKVSTGEVINYDLLVWTGGVRAVKVPFKNPVRLDPKDRIIVDQYLRAPGYENIFAIGDNALILDADKRPVPGNATQAVWHGEYVAGYIVDKILDQPPKVFKPKNFGYIIAVSGKWAAMELPSHFKVFGFFGWLAHRYADFRYFKRFMSVWDANKLAWFDTEMYVRND